MDERGVAPVVGKALEAGIVVLYVTLVAATMFGTVVPDSRSAAGDEVAERALTAAAVAVERGVPPAVKRATVRVTVDLPATIDGRAYAVRAANRTLVLEHPARDMAVRVPLSLPPSTEVSGAWESGVPAVAVVRRVNGSTVVRLEADG